MSRDIAVVGMACQYPDADSPARLWENVLAGRRAFRQIPEERLRLADYWSADRDAPDRCYAGKAAVLEGWEFDRVRYRVAGSTYRATDLTHWLALDTAARALADAGFPEGSGLPRATTAVVIGNSLTGEFARASLMRLRWPYVRRTVGAALRDLDWQPDTIDSFLSDVETRYKGPFPPIDEDTLAGGLSNTIAGRICNYFDLNGGGFTVDGACSSSLLSVLTACNALSHGQADVALAGGVDLSIDPFEMVGFAKTGALAADDMRVYDKNSSGFWPGEGCGMLVLMRGEQARSRGLRCYATIAGWGMSSDGKGSITRPELNGHLLAIDRAYQMAGFSAATVGYFEGHGTGTAVGDATELRALAAARREAEPDAAPTAIGTVKGNIGHTKAAAGVAGLIKTVLAVQHEVIPPATSHRDAHAELTGPRPALRVPRTAEPWPARRPVRAGVSAMGFGGINTHIVITGAEQATGSGPDPATLRIVNGRQDRELLLIDADSHAALRDRVAAVAGLVPRLSFAELADLAATLEKELTGGPVRAAVVAASPDQAQRQLAALLGQLDATGDADGPVTCLDPAGGIFLGSGREPGRIGYLFPGQGSGAGPGGGLLARRFATVRALYAAMRVAQEGDLIATAVAQPRITVSSMAGLRVLAELGITAQAAAGHSLGELTALHWAGAMDEAGLYALAGARGAAMAELGDGDGAMAGLAAPEQDVVPLLADEAVVIGGYNGPRQTVVSGPAAAVARVRAAAAARGIHATPLAVSHAFHSPGVAPAAAALDAYLAGLDLRPLRRTVISTVTGMALEPDADLRRLLVTQVTEPVRFGQAVARLAADCDLLIEVGPGRVLSALASTVSPQTPSVALDTDSPSIGGLLSAVAAGFALGCPVRPAELFRGRLVRPFPLSKVFRFLASPCESAPREDAARLQPAGTVLTGTVLTAPPQAAPPQAAPPQAPARTGPGLRDADADGGGASAVGGDRGAGSLDILRQLMADRAELPPDAIRPDTRPLDELHLSSITVGEIVNRAARELGLAPLLLTSGFATATLAELAAALDEMASTELPGDEQGGGREAAGVAPWVRAFTVELTPSPVPDAPACSGDGEWQVFTTPGHPLAAPLGDALRRAGLGGGVLLCLPAECGEGDTGLMLEAARAALGRPGPSRLVVVQDERGAAALAKSLHLEAPSVTTTLVVLPLPAMLSDWQRAAATARITADVAATTGFAEVHYDAAGRRMVPVLRLAAGPRELPARPGPLRADDVVLATGGGKGITAECALALARESGAAIALLGRSDPACDAELAASLSRLAAAGVRYAYVRGDVTSPAQVRAAVAEVTAALGPVTAVLHGAGRNVPGALRGLDADAFAATLAPKITGLRNVLDALDPASLKLLVTFGSIIGRAGLRGQADYAVANDWLTIETGRFQDRYPACRCVALEWSVWSGSGMGERLGVVESLAREGITPIPVDEGVDLLLRAIADPARPRSLVITGRLGGLPTIMFEPRELPLTRFTELPRVSYPGIELVTEAELSRSSDPYLADHHLDGNLLFPAVIGMEAMAQVASALAPPGSGGLTFENAEFLRPVVVPPAGGTTIRVAALALGDRIDVVIRSSETDFSADHFRATIRPRDRQPRDQERPVPSTADAPIALDPLTDLYGDVLFQGERFRLLSGYRRLSATSCTAQIAAGNGLGWFAAYLPATLLLGDPGARDVFMHAIQCCVPDATLLPVAVRQLELAAPGAAGPFTMTAAQQSREGDTYLYDLTVRDADGRLVERWTGLRLRAVRRNDGSGPWPPVLAGTYLEGQLAELLPGSPRCVTEPAVRGDARREQTAAAVSRLLGRPGSIIAYRADGRPEVAGEDICVSASHARGVTFAVAARTRVCCDVEPVTQRSERDWRDLVGGDQYGVVTAIAQETGDELDVAATRVWGAVECLRKAGQAVAGPLVLDCSPKPGWVLLRCGRARVASFRTRLRGEENPFVFSVLEGSGE